jgi:hypothetical protein
MTRTTGRVYVQTNDADANEVIVYGRAEDGTLGRLNVYPTGGVRPDGRLEALGSANGLPLTAAGLAAS